ncbi:hypothetical protein GALMADRAFT_130409 [Galerina marginata CBS 339.88]|uniref:Uncharacterized protein n=1 Tax=Galerina marginata (strain CBS 339.88) TaxID=685588 RepID=A0A067SBM3_GALM3|nr:hypothetical protein GALMADRAFT_130409 [Galerina marginata CBS 339.88]
MMTFKYFVLCLLSGARLASALPASKIAGSADIKHVIKHTHEDSYYHGDVASIYPRASGCSPLSIEQLKQLPGWSKIQQYASDTYGGGGVNIVVNPSEYPDRPAVVCLKDGVVPIQVQGAPSCTSTTSQMDSGSKGTSGQNSISLQQGYSNTGTWTVTQESSLAVGASLSVTVGIPEVADVSASVTTTATITNSLANSFSTTASDQTTQTITYNVGDGQNCLGTVCLYFDFVGNFDATSTLQITTKTCNVQGKGSAAYVATGYVWFNYDDARTSKSDPNGGKHYKYSVDIASVLSNINDRSSSLTFSGSMQISSKTHSNAKCSPQAAKAKALAKSAKAKSKATKLGSKAVKAKPTGMKAKAKATTSRPKATKAKPKGMSARPKGSKVQPKTTKAHPRPPATKAKPKGTQPKGMNARPNGNKVQTKAAKAHPRPPATKPKPKTTKAQPRPAATKPKPKVTKVHPTSTSAKPEATKV